MSVSDEYFEEGDGEIIESIKESLEHLVKKGLITVVGIGDDGQWWYQATDKGRKFTADNKTFKDIEGFEGLS